LTGTTGSSETETGRPLDSGRPAMKKLRIVTLGSGVSGGRAPNRKQRPRGLSMHLRVGIRPPQRLEHKPPVGYRNDSTCARAASRHAAEPKLAGSWQVSRHGGARGEPLRVRVPHRGGLGRRRRFGPHHERRHRAAGECCLESQQTSTLYRTPHPFGGFLGA
jgi:hypothetical protein